MPIPTFTEAVVNGPASCREPSAFVKINWRPLLRSHPAQNVNPFAMVRQPCENQRMRLLPPTQTGRSNNLRKNRQHCYGRGRPHHHQSKTLQLDLPQDQRCIPLLLQLHPYLPRSCKARCLGLLTLQRASRASSRDGRPFFCYDLYSSGLFLLKVKLWMIRVRDLQACWRLPS